MANKTIETLTELASPANDDVLHIVDVSAVAHPKDRKITKWNLIGYTEYVALLTQTGTDAPTATVIKNDTGATVVFARGTTGVYTATFSSAILTTNKTAAMILPTSSARQYGALVADNSVINITTASAAGLPTDSILNSTLLIIRIYI